MMRLHVKFPAEFIGCLTVVMLSKSTEKVSLANLLVHDGSLSCPHSSRLEGNDSEKSWNYILTVF